MDIKKWAVGPVALCTTAMFLTGCSNMTETQSNTAKGAGIGAGVGAAIGVITAGGHKGRSAATGAAIGAGVGALGAYVWSQRMEQQKAEMERATQGTGIDVVQTQDNQIKVDIPSDAGFDTGRSTVRPELAGVLRQFSMGMRNNPTTRINIVGHTDNTGNDSINNPLSRDRAASTRDYLVSQGVPYERITIDGRGSSQPVASNDSASGRARNRRVEIYVAQPQQVSQAPQQGQYPQQGGQYPQQGQYQQNRY